jgi:hypothetical protein
VFDQQLHDLIFGLGIFFFKTEFLPHAVSPDQAGHGIFELRDDVTQCGFIGRILDVQNDVGVDAQFLSNAHGTDTAVSMLIVVNRDFSGFCHRNDGNPRLHT